MTWYTAKLKVGTSGKGLYEITADLESLLRQWGVNDGMCHVFIQHTSASLCISENADPSARADLARFLDELVPENQSWHKHTYEGPDDSPSHMRSIITSMGESIPITNGKLDLGTWQGLYVFEHRSFSHTRSVVVKVQS